MVPRTLAKLYTRLTSLLYSVPMPVYGLFPAARLAEANPALTMALKHTSIRTVLKEKGERHRSVVNVYVRIFITHSFRSLHTLI